MIYPLYIVLDWLQAEGIVPRPDPLVIQSHQSTLKREHPLSFDMDESDIQLLDPDDVADITRIKVS
jgi:hypothetical protein